MKKWFLVIDDDWKRGIAGRMAVIGLLGWLFDACILSLFPISWFIDKFYDPRNCP